MDKDRPASRFKFDPRQTIATPCTGSAPRAKSLASMSAPPSPSFWRIKWRSVWRRRRRSAFPLKASGMNNSSRKLSRNGWNGPLRKNGPALDGCQRALDRLHRHERSFGKDLSVGPARVGARTIVLFLPRFPKEYVGHVQTHSERAGKTEAALWIGSGSCAVHAETHCGSFAVRERTRIEALASSRIEWHSPAHRGTDSKSGDHRLQRPAAPDSAARTARASRSDLSRRGGIHSTAAVPGEHRSQSRCHPRQSRGTSAPPRIAHDGIVALPTGWDCLRRRPGTGDSGRRPGPGQNDPGGGRG